MEPRYRLRLYLLTALVLTGFGALLTRLYEFQIERRDEFLKEVPGNSTVTVREPGIRGELTDRNGILLAPLTAARLADAMLDGAALPPAWRPDRFA